MNSENAPTSAPLEPLVGPFAVANTDRELWRERPGDYYADSIHVTEGGGIGINVGGLVIVRPLREWHRAMRLMTPMTAGEADAAYDDAPAIPMSDVEIQSIVAKVTASDVEQHNAWVEELKADVEFEPLKGFIDRLKE